jgi:hypothetical protein
MLQYYLKDEGVSLSWVGTGRLNFSLDFTPADMQRLQDAIVRACKRMIQVRFFVCFRFRRLAVSLRARRSGLSNLSGCRSCRMAGGTLMTTKF